DFHVTGVQTCALPICARALVPGTLRGYRTWRLLRRAPEDGALPLTSVTRGVRWAPTLTAECAPLEPGVDGLPEGAGAHRAPTARSEERRVGKEARSRR